MLSKNKGAIFAPGLTFGVVDWLEVGVLALLGKNSQGLEPNLTSYFLKGAWKPLLNVGMPIGLNGGVRVGLRGAAGVQWDPIRHFGMFAQVGGAYFFNVSAPLEKAYFLPSIGVQGRI